MEDESQRYTKLKISNIELVDGKTESATFTFFEEDHTMGNSLRYFLAKNPKVTFAGYSIPHPSDPIMNLRIQTVGLISHIRICPDTNIEGYTAVEALKQALQDLQQVCNHIKTTFQTQVETQ